MPGYGTGQSQEQVAAIISTMMPAPATVMPPPTALDSGKGSSDRFAREDHTHAARVQRTVLTTAADGTLTWTFARPIVCTSGKVPPITYMVEDPGTPVVVQITARTFTSDAQAGTDTHTAVTIKAQRSRVLPATLISLAALISFDIFGAAAGATKVNLFAADPTQ